METKTARTKITAMRRPSRFNIFIFFILASIGESLEAAANLLAS